MEKTETRREKGTRVLENLFPGSVANLQKAWGNLAPEVVDYIVDFGYGEVLCRQELSPADRQLVTIAELASLGNAPAQLAFHIEGGLNVGLTPRDVVEIMHLVAVFAGFPAELNGLAVAREVFQRCGEPVGPGPEIVGDRRERGLAALEATSGPAGRKVVETLGQTTPELAGFILDFSYGDVISRPVLSPKRKEMVMVAAAAARGTMAPQMAVHLRAGRAVGLSRAEMVEIMYQTAVYAGFPAALNGLAVVREVWESEG